MRARTTKRSKRKVVFKGRFLKLMQMGEWEFVQRNNCTGIVIIVPVTDDNHLLFVEQYRPPVGKKTIEFPAGLVNDRGHKRKESVMTAAKRELVEETGYQAKTMIKLFNGPVSGGSSADILTMYLARDVQRVSEGGGDEFESIIVHKIPRVKADTWLIGMNKKGCMIEPKIYAGLYFLKTYNK